MLDRENNNIKEILDKAQDEDIIYALTCAKFLSDNQDLLLNHQTDSMSPKVFFSKALNCEYVYRESDKNLQSGFVKSALDYGINITEVKSYLSLEFLSEHQDILLNHPNNPMAPKVFFEKALNYYAYRESDKEIQSGFVKLALDYGVDITEVVNYLSLEFLSEHQDILLNHPNNPMAPKVFFKKALNDYAYKESDQEIQSGFVKLALDYRVDITEVKSYFSLEFLVRNQDILLNHPTNPITPSFFLRLSIIANPFNIREYNIERISSVKYDLIKKAIELGANVNQDISCKMGNVSLLDIADTPGVIALLKSYGAECGAASRAMSSLVAQENLQEYLDNPQGISYNLSNNLLIDKGYFNNIPYIVHHVWFTHPDIPREISDSDIENTIKTKETFGDNVSKWSHIVWTNDKDLIPNSVKILEENGIEVRSIQDYQEDFRLFDQVMDLIDKKLWGMASDVLRYNALEKFGGIYSDLNFEFKRSIEEDLYKYDFVAQDFINYFFAVKPNHPIMTNLVNMVEENLSNPPSYMSYMDDKAVFDKTVFVSLAPFSIAILKSNNLDGNIDMIYSPKGYEGSVDYYGNELQEYYPSDYLSNDGNCDSFWDLITLGFAFEVPQNMNSRIGVDGYKDSTLTWIEDSGNETFYY